MKQSRSAILLIIFLVLAAALLALCSPMLFKKKEVKSTQDAPTVTNKILSAKGVVESLEDVVIGSQVAGIIVGIRAKEGDSVRKGQQLVILDNAKISAQLAQAKAMTREAKSKLRELESGYRTEDVEMVAARVKRTETVFNQAKDEYQRLDRLYRKDATTLIERDRANERMKVAADELSDARANLQKYQRGERKENIEQARASLARISSEEKYHEAILKDYVILSPIDGVVTERKKEPGETVDVGTPLMRLINPNKMRIRAELEESDVGKAVSGDQVEVYSDAFRAKVFRGKVSQVFPNVKKKAQKTFDPMASFDINTQTIYIQLDDFSGLQNGMTVTVRFLK
jgi:multidrug resistance efflux pump